MSKVVLGEGAEDGNRPTGKASRRRAQSSGQEQSELAEGPGYDRETTRYGRKPRARADDFQGVQQDNEESDKTVRFGRSKRSEEHEKREEVVAPQADRSLAGWLVIIEGPGTGAAVSVRAGQNSLGRNKDNDLAIDFGDRMISGREHCFVIYDPKSREFLVRAGSGKNLTYLNETRIDVTAPLDRGSVIVVGETQLRFVPFCDENFDWTAS